MKKKGGEKVYKNGAFLGFVDNKIYDNSGKSKKLVQVEYEYAPNYKKTIKMDTEIVIR
jgi:hypothetical protein